MKIALLPGGFKPPHLGHYNMAKYLADFADKVIVRIGQKEREGIGPELALEVWNYYKAADPDGRAQKLIISVAQSPSPVKDVYDFVEKIAPEGSTVVLGMGEKDAKDGRYNNIPKFAEPRNIKAEIKLVPPQAGGISGTRMREIIKSNNKEEFFKYIPDFLPEEIKEEVWTKLVDSTMPTGVDEMMAGTMNAEEMAKHNANMKKLRKFFSKQGDQMTQIPTNLTKGLRRKLYEGRYDQETLMQSRFLVNAFKAEFGKNTEESTDGTLSYGVDYDLDYIFEPNAEEVQPLAFIVDGEADIDTLQIRIKYDPDKFPEAYTDLVPEIKDTIRHELEHIAQFNFSKGVNPDSQKLSKYTWFQYFTFPHEIPAFAQGLYKKAKTKRISFTDAVNDFLLNYLDVLTDEEEIKVKQAWTDYAKENLPAAQINEDADLINNLIGSGALDWLIEWIYSDRFKYSDIETQRFIAQIENQSWRKEFFGSDAFKEFKKILGASILYSRLQLLFQKDFPLGNKEKILQTFEKLKNHPIIGRIGKAIVNTIAGTPLAAEIAADSFKKGYSKFFNMMEKAQFIKILDNVPNEIKEKLRQQSDEILKNSQLSEGDTYEKMAAKGKKAGNLKQGTVRKRLNIPKGEKIPLSLINKELSRLKKMEKRSAKNQKYYKALTLAKTLKTTTHKENIDPKAQKKHKGKSAPYGSAYEPVGENFPPYKANQVQQTRYRSSDTFTNDPKKAKKLGYLQEKDPKVGTGKKPKGSGRRLYTDENPKDTISIKFSTRQDIVDTLSKKSFKAKSHARQSQIINLIHQRVRAAYGRAKDPAVKKRLKSGLDYITKRKEASKRKTQRMKKENINEGLFKSLFRATVGPVILRPIVTALFKSLSEKFPNKKKLILEMQPIVMGAIAAGKIGSVFELTLFIKNNNEELAEMITQASKELVRIVKQNIKLKESATFSKDWWLDVINEEILYEGGAAGHMAHPFDLPSVNNGKDLIKAFEQAADSLKKSPGSVKIDGVNASIRLINLDGKRIFAMDRGSKKALDLRGVTKADLEDRFGAGHGMIKAGGNVLDIFNDALPSIQGELKALGLYDDPNIMFNMEYVSGKSNVQDYGKNFLAIHGLLKVETKEVQGARKMLTKRVTSEKPYDKTDLETLLKKLEPFAKKKGFEIYGSVPTTFKKDPDFKSALNTKYTIDFAEGDKTKTLGQWLNDVNSIPKTDRLTMNIDKGTEGVGVTKDVGALSKQVYFAVFGEKNIDDLFDNEQEVNKAIQGATTYLATEKLGDAILDVLDSPMGSVNDHEGVVIRDTDISPKPFKVTGKFITGGVSSDFQKK